jgi:hypothetical protein
MGHIPHDSELRTPGAGGPQGNLAVRGAVRMTLKAYIDNIQAKTGQTPRDFARRARVKGFLKPEVTPEQIVTWLNEEFGLGRGHALAIYSLLKPKMGKVRKKRVAVGEKGEGSSK